MIGPIGHGALDLPLACARATGLATRTFRFTVTAPRGTDIRDYRRGFRETEVKGQQYTAEDEQVKLNRLQLLKHLRDTFISGVADFGRIQSES